ncbi:MAG: sulfur carrier protein ThiS [Coxiella-like endosymbiont]|uniref:sulfur carrier protein ThiS n=1 Tax=Coxiella-like endosymbiont TaxID=1592897 RepID=UPI00215A8EDA|nr:sulfur carrier protein ThiS [Coxiella-like endosymbiont]UVE59599.1 sulfur carrier protein ThiS [Coxiella-like endosymbiont]
MIDIFLNGKHQMISSEMTLKTLLSEANFTGAFVVAVNETIINNTNYEKIVIQPGDRIEVITAMCGG